MKIAPWLIGGFSEEPPKETKFTGQTAIGTVTMTGPYSKAVQYDDDQCRMFYEVVLRPDQIDLIAKRVVDLLKDNP
jgi:hypothetical protein